MNFFFLRIVLKFQFAFSMKFFEVFQLSQFTPQNIYFLNFKQLIALLSCCSDLLIVHYHSNILQFT